MTTTEIARGGFLKARTPQRNARRLREVARRVERHPEQYDQTKWGDGESECGTVACVAGWGALVAGRVPRTEGWRPLCGMSYWAWGEIDVHNVGQQALGLTDHEAAVLFHHQWAPADWASVAVALRCLADGAPLSVVTDPDRYWEAADEWVLGGRR